jgi:hypothetical protein
MYARRARENWDVQAAPPATGGDRASQVSLSRGLDGQLQAHRGDESAAVWVCRSFPWSEPTRFISLRDEDEKEFALVRNPNELDPASRRELEQALAQAGFVLEITRVISVEEEVEIRSWVVDTAQGRRHFQTRRDDWPWEVPGGGLLIRDVAGDLFLVAKPSNLDAQSRDALWAFID